MPTPSSRYIENLERVLQMYQQGECEFIEGNFYCNICGNKTRGAMLSFEFQNPPSIRTEFYHVKELD